MLSYIQFGYTLTLIITITVIIIQAAVRHTGWVFTSVLIGVTSSRQVAALKCIASTGTMTVCQTIRVANVSVTSRCDVETLSVIAVEHSVSQQQAPQHQWLAQMTRMIITSHHLVWLSTSNTQIHSFQTTLTLIHSVTATRSKLCGETLLRRLSVLATSRGVDRM